MTIHGFKVASIAVMTAMACLLLTAPNAMADKGAYKLEGAWVAKVIGFPGQWSYVLAADPSGRRASGHGSVDIGFDPSVFGCALGDANADSQILISLKMTGPDTSVAYSIWYALTTADPASTEIVFIGEVRSESRFVAPGKSESTHYFSFYLPSQDLDPADGFPDEGETPACSAPGFSFANLESPPRARSSSAILRHARTREIGGEETMSIKLRVATALSTLPLFLGLSHAAGAGEPPLTRTIQDPALEWGPCPAVFPAGCEIAVLHGDPAQPNADLYFKVGPGYSIPHHWHTSAERMTLVSGRLRVTYDGHEPATLEVGTYAYGPAGAPHTGECLSKEPCVLFIAFEGPVDVQTKPASN